MATPALPEADLLRPSLTHEQDDADESEHDTYECEQCTPHFWVTLDVPRRHEHICRPGPEQRAEGKEYERKDGARLHDELRQDLVMRGGVLQIMPFACWRY